VAEPADKTAPAARTTALSLNIKDVSVLQSAYMPYVKGGGMFIPTSKAYVLGEELFMLIVLPGDTNRMPVAGKVIWVTPAGAQGNKLQGVGVQFKDDESGNAAKHRIETLLAGLSKSNSPTHTM
jgi:type IV pilus assembly protein PilZ